jgi:hypothetical protein
MGARALAARLKLAAALPPVVPCRRPRQGALIAKAGEARPAK